MAPVMSAETPVVETAGETGSVEAQGSEAKPGAPAAEASYEVVDGVKTPLPIAVSGDLKIMPPATGLPVASNAGPRNSGLKALLDAIPPAAETAETKGESATETAAHGN